MFEKRSEERNLERLKLQVEIVQHLLNYRFTWDEIFEAIGFSEEWFETSKQIIKKHEEES